MKSVHCILRRTLPAIIWLLAGNIGYAQEGITFTAPFDFTIGRQTLPAGQYTIRPLPQSLRKLLLRSQSGQILTFLQTDPMESQAAPASPTVVFSRYGGQYFLSQIWEGSNEFGQRVAKSPAEIELAESRRQMPELIALSSSGH